MTGLPSWVQTAAYDARWSQPDAEDDQAEARYLAGIFFTHGIPLVAALESVEFSDKGLNDLCHALARALENEIEQIKRRGDL